MNITAFSPALTLLYVIALLWILMGVNPKSFTKKQRWLVPAVILILCGVNQLLDGVLDPVSYGRLLIIFMHLPTFLLFLYITKSGIIKTAFMILTAIVFTGPTVLASNQITRIIPKSPINLLIINLVSYAVMLLLAQFVFRKCFNYLLVFCDNRFFLLLSLVPVVYYIYVLAIINLDISSLSSVAGYVMRILPTIDVFLFYFLLPYIYKALSEKMSMQSEQDALQQKITSSENQIALLNEANMKMAVYRHDVRHQFILLDGLLSGQKIEQAQEFVKAAVAELNAIAPKRFCENETVNLLCSSYDSKAQRLGVRLKIEALLPQKLPLSDIELCSVVSNGLENALQAASQTELADKWVEFYCEVKQNKLLLQIQNPYVGEVVMNKGLPVSARAGHGYGCHSIQTIVQRHDGLCSFSAEKGLFTLRLVISLSE